jgi:hypothetical protein
MSRFIWNPAKTLDELLRVLVRAWGYDTVLGHLRDLENADLERAYARNRHRRNAVDYIEPMELPVQQKDMLRELAYRFQSKQFLPTLGDIRYFLERNRGTRADGIRSRDAAMPHVFDILRALRYENLNSILHDDNYAGPSRLGPLSDAIRAHTIGSRAIEKPVEPAEQRVRDDRGEPGGNRRESQSYDLLTP